jgi:hypothetical protein
MSKHFRLRRPLGSLAFATMLSLWWASAIPAPAQNPQPENKQADSIRGVVVNSVTHEPVGRALVYSNDNRFATMTDREGHFEFTFPPEQTNDKEGATESTNAPSIMGGNVTCGPGGCITLDPPYRGPTRPQMLAARKPGFLDERNGTLNGAPNLQAAVAGKELTIEITPEALIVGRVTLPTSEASDPIQVEIYRRRVLNGLAHWARAGGASTKSSGEFRFADLSAGTYKLLTRELMDRDSVTFDPRGQLYGYPPIYFPNATDFAGAQTIQLAAGQVYQANITLVKHPYYPVKVALAHVPTGVGGLSVVVSPMGHRGPGFALGYNNDDQAIEGSLPDGNYTLEASSYGPNAVSGLLNISVKGAALEGPRMSLVPNGSISVNVKEEFTSTEDAGPQREFVINGQRELGQGPRRYLNVFLQPADDFGNGGGFSLRPPSGPEDDALAIDGVAPGRYWVSVNSSRGFVAAIDSGITDLQHQPLVVGVGGSGAPIEITVRDAAAEIDGTVEGAAAPLTPSDGTVSRPQGDNSTAHVYCIPLADSSGEFREIRVSTDGKFGPQELPPGTYRVLAFDRTQPELEYRNAEAMRAYESKGQAVRLIPGQKEHLHLQVISSSEQP